MGVWVYGQVMYGMSRRYVRPVAMPKPHSFRIQLTRTPPHRNGPSVLFRRVGKRTRLASGPRRRPLTVANIRWRAPGLWQLRDTSGAPRGHLESSHLSTSKAPREHLATIKLSTCRGALGVLKRCSRAAQIGALELLKWCYLENNIF